ncbi:C6 transcription factor [Lecanosticta acicola]|uniref:C6 transcription factor n=1 Tax=Lecanosticta acicola TaxID=111012 RepID=A0AAI8Z8N6_9PEZI|nr:C6 transcription factor [Lecanosticta acicola]
MPSVEQLPQSGITVENDTTQDLLQFLQDDLQGSMDIDWTSEDLFKVFGPNMSTSSSDWMDTLSWETSHPLPQDADSIFDNMDMEPSQAIAPVARMVSTPSPSDLNSSDSHETQHHCLAAAMEFMLSLFPPGHLDCSRPQAFDAILERNHQAMEGLNAILNCGCPKDGYLTSILSLILLKVLACGEAVQRDVSTAHREHGNPCSMRKSAQAVMADLHKVHRLLKSIYSRFGEMLLQHDLSALFGDALSSSSSNHNYNSTTGAQKDYTTEANDSCGGAELSQNMIKGLDAEMRGRFRAVSDATIASLRLA